MKKPKSASIVNISSMYGEYAPDKNIYKGTKINNPAAYSVAKAGILNLTQNLGREWATLGVRVNAIRPGFFPTEWNRKNFITPERERAILAHTPMERYGQPEELVGAMIWLASDASGFVTGAEITVDRVAPTLGIIELFVSGAVFANLINSFGYFFSFVFFNSFSVDEAETTVLRKLSLIICADIFFKDL